MQLKPLRETAARLDPPHTKLEGSNTLAVSDDTQCQSGRSNLSVNARAHDDAKRTALSKYHRVHSLALKGKNVALYLMHLIHLNAYVSLR